MGAKVRGTELKAHFNKQVRGHVILKRTTVSTTVGHQHKRWADMLENKPLKTFETFRISVL
jgi:hypothetical protein